jgi:hypothetical protein
MIAKGGPFMVEVNCQPRRSAKNANESLYFPMQARFLIVYYLSNLKSGCRMHTKVSTLLFIIYYSEVEIFKY